MSLFQHVKDTFSEQLALLVCSQVSRNKEQGYQQLYDALQKNGLEVGKGPKDTRNLLIDLVAFCSGERTF